MKQGSIVIDPVTRIEGHSKITLHLNDDGRVEDARFHVTQFRGFEKLVRGAAILRDAVADGAHLRHLPGQPSHRLGEGLRRVAGGTNSARRRTSCAASLDWRRSRSRTR